ncbi:hypothetical protein CH72_6517 [Burkholderia ambifaria AMMD]|jgi:hypothetical protein|nr:hypothetical protein CH72_6517 [Burkholderia ambifaria AMMD]
MLIAAGRKRNLLPVMAVRVVLIEGIGVLRDAGLEWPSPWITRNDLTPRSKWMYCWNEHRPPSVAGRRAMRRMPFMGSRSAAYQPARPGTVSPRSEHPRVSITPASATSPTAQAAIM